LIFAADSPIIYLSKRVRRKAKIRSSDLHFIKAFAIDSPPLWLEGIMSLEELKDEAMKLAPEARARLAHALLASLEDLSEAEIELLWIDEALRRDEEIDSGRAPLRLADEVLKDARLRLR
jgi:hypothetical protein